VTGTGNPSALFAIQPHHSNKTDHLTMKTIQLILILFIGICILYSCDNNNSKFDELVSSHERLIYSNPDSALILIPELVTSNKEQESRKSLLTVKTLSKSNLPLPDDSILKTLSDFYSCRNDSLEYQSLFYYGEKLSVLNKDDDALITLHKAYDLSTSHNDGFFAAMIARELSTVYGRQYIMDQALKWAITAFDHFNNAGKKRHAEWMRDRIAHYYTYTGDFNHAIAVLDSTDTEIYENEPTLRHLITEEKAWTFYQMKNYTKAIKEWNNLLASRGWLESRDWANYAEMMIRLNEPSNAALALDSAKIHCNSTIDSLYIDYATAQLYGKTGNYKEGYFTAINFANRMIADNERRLMKPKILALNNYLNTVTTIQKQEIKTARQQKYLALTLLFLSIVLIVLMTYTFFDKIKRRKEKEIEMLLHLEKLEKEATTNKQLSQELRDALNQLFEQKFELLNKLYDSWHGNPGTTSTNPILHRELGKILDELRSKDTLDNLESLINIKNNQWMTKFKTNFPDLTLRQYELATYLYLGFSTETISVLMGKKSINAVYIDKHRLKKKILTSRQQDTKLWLEKLHLLQ